MPDLYEQDANEEHPAFLSGMEHDTAEAVETEQKKNVYELVLEHLLSGKPLGQSEALTGFGCKSLKSTVSHIRDKGFVVATIPRRDEFGNPDSFYRMHPDDQPKLDPPLPSDHHPTVHTDVYQQDVPIPHEEQETVESRSVRKNAMRADSVTLRIGSDGPEIQVLSNDDDEGSNVFYKLTPVQVRYLSLNLKLFEEMHGSAG